MIAEILGTKTESHCRSFFVNYRRRYNLDSALKEYEAEHGPAVDSGEAGAATTESTPVDSAASSSSESATPEVEGGKSSSSSSKK